MALKTRFVRDSRDRVCGTVTSGYPDGSEAVRNRNGQLIGHVLNTQKITKDIHNCIIAHNAEFGLSEE